MPRKQILRGFAVEVLEALAPDHCRQEARIPKQQDLVRQTRDNQIINNTTRIMPNTLNAKAAKPSEASLKQRCGRRQLSVTSSGRT